MIVTLYALCIKSGAQSNSILGSEIQWKSTVNDTYEIKIIVYCQDNLTPLWNLPLISSDSCAANINISTDSALGHLTEELTSVCPSGQNYGQYFQWGGFKVVKHTLSYKILLGNADPNCCWYKIHWAACCRIATSTGFANTPYSTDAWLNRSIKNNQSPEFRNPPDVFLQVNRTVRYSHEVLDLDGDSLSYALVAPNGGSYSSNLSYGYPLNCVGDNNPSVSPTVSGFNLNPGTGEIIFTPKKYQSSIYKLMVSEWRKDTMGHYKVIGKTAREMCMIVIPYLFNHTPVASSPQSSYETCAGSPICISVYTMDQDQSDNSYIKWNMGNTNASWLLNWNDTYPEKESGHLCWTPVDQEVRALPYYFTATVTDDHCYINGMSAKNYAIMVRPRMKASTRVQELKPGKYAITLRRDAVVDTRASSITFYASTVVGETLNKLIVYNVSNKDSATLNYYFGEEGKYIIRTVINYGNCSNTYLDTVVVKEKPEFSRISGEAFCNTNSDCKMDKDETAIPGTLITTRPFTQTVFTDSAGHYNLFLDSGVYIINAELPDYLKKIKLSDVCPTNGNYNVAITDKLIYTTGNNFSEDIIKVPILSVDFNQSRMRLCNYVTGYLEYGNIGTKDTFNVKVFLVLPRNIHYNSSSEVCDIIGDTLVFHIDTLKAGKKSVINVVTEIDCNSKLTGEYRCFRFGISPDNLRYNNLVTPKGYDFSNIKTKAECLDSGYLKFSILNDGEAMNDSNEYRLFHNSKLCYSGRFRLGALGKKEFMIASATGIYRLEANQNFYYPTFSNPHSVIRACADSLLTDTGNLNSMETSREGYTFKEKCYRLVSAYDPNTITVVPEGIGELKIVKRGIPLQYRIDFQNTGKDTAYDIIVTDTLPLFLDLSTLEWGGASHYYTTDISGPNKNILKFSFRKIFLVDSNANEPGSHGFITFSIKPFSNIASGTKIENSASIFFDFNDPVTTNSAWVTVSDADQLSPDFPSKLIKFPTLNLDLIPDVCVNSGPLDLNLLTHLRPEFRNGSLGKWYINKAPLSSSIFNPEKIKVGWGDTIPVKVFAEYNYNFLGSMIKDTITFKVQPAPRVTLSMPIRYYSHCDSTSKGFDITGTVPQSSKSKSRFLIDQIEIKGNTFVPSGYDSGWHKVTHIFESANGCSAFADDSFYIEEIPDFEIQSDITSGCNLAQSHFSAVQFNEPGQESQYLWDFGDPQSGSLNLSTLSNPVHAFQLPGQYAVRCIITRPRSGCKGKSRNTILIKVSEVPELTLRFTPDSPFYAGVSNPEFSFHGVNINQLVEIKSWKWWWDEPIDYEHPDDTIPDVLHRYAQDTASHTVTCQITSTEGCTAEIKRTVKINAEIYAFVPNAFTPDGNGLNEKFKAEVSGIRSMEMRIYNQWGELVYCSQKDSDIGWDGQFDGLPAPCGIYIYKLNITGYYGEERSLEGTLHLIR
jgi:gliding motility-associated-like protein/uncharacterized repeat protein (TIGR01451 family)